MQIFKIRRVIILITFVIHNIQAELNPNGKNVCLKSETYEKKIDVNVMKPRIIINKKWCWSLKKLFQCTNSDTKWEPVTELRSFNRTRIVPKCCDGFKEEKKQETICLPVCLKGCVNGKCVAPEICACDSGYYGSECKKECPEGLWGKNCIHFCDCSNNGNCDKVSGVCKCKEGWTGDRCESSCPDGYYGDMCKMRCNCLNQPCDHKTGECFITTPLTPQSFAKILTTTESIVAEKSLPILQSNNKKKILTELSVNEVLRMTEENEITAVSTLEETITTTGMTDLVTSETTDKKYMNFSVITDSTKNTEQIISSNFSSVKTFPADVVTDETATEISVETIIHVEEKNVLNGSQKFNDKEMTNNINEISEPETTAAPKDKTIKDVSGVNFSGRKEVFINNFINKEKENSTKKFRIFQFLLGLSVFSVASFLLCILASMWMINKHRNKTKKKLAQTKKTDKISQLKVQMNFPSENFWENNCTNNPVYLSDSEIVHTTPVLNTFKPLACSRNVTAKEKEIHKSKCFFISDEL